MLYFLCNIIVYFVFGQGNCSVCTTPLQLALCSVLKWVPVHHMYLANTLTYSTCIYMYMINFLKNQSICSCYILISTCM